MAEVMATDDASQLIQVGIDACALRLSALVARWRLLDAEAIGAGVGDVEPGQKRDFQTFFTAPVAAVPEVLKTIGVGATLGDKAGVDNEGLLMLRRNDLGNGRLVEGDKVKVSVVPPRKEPAPDSIRGTLVIGTGRVRG